MKRTTQRPPVADPDTESSRVTQLRDFAEFERHDGPPSHPSIEQLAFELYLAEGRPHGRALDHWLRAERTYYEEAAKWAIA